MLSNEDQKVDDFSSKYGDNLDNELCSISVERRTHKRNPSGLLYLPKESTTSLTHEMDSGHHSPYCASPISPIRFISLDGNSEFCFKIPSPCSHDCDTVFSFSEMETSSVDHFSTPSSPRPVSAKCAMDVLPENPSADINQLKDGPRLKRKSSGSPTSCCYV